MSRYHIVKTLNWPDGSERYREWNDGLKCWYGSDGVGLHRDDGPAIITSRGQKEFWYKGEFLPTVYSVDELIIKMIIE